MPKTRLISPGSIPNHKLLKNLQLQGNYISNDGDNEGFSMNDAGYMTLAGTILAINATTIISPTALTSSSGLDYTLNLSETLNLGSGEAGGYDSHFGIYYNQTQTNTAGWDNVYLMHLYGGDAARTFAIRDDGKVGIGINAPTAKLEIENTSAAPALKIDNDAADQIALEIEAVNTTAPIISIVTATAIEGNILYFVDNSSSATARDCVAIAQLNPSATGATALDVTSSGGVTGMTLDKNVSNTNVSAATFTGLEIDFDHTVPDSGTATQNDIGINLDLNSATLGTSTSTGIDIDVVGAISETHTAIGLAVDVGSADVNYAALFNGGNVGIGVTDPASPLEIFSTSSQFKISYDASYYADISVANDGHLELATTGSTNSDITLDAAGAINIEPSRYINLKKSGTTDGEIVIDLNSDPLITISSDDDNGDLFEIQVNAAGASTISTTDDDGEAAHLTIAPDGDLILDPVSQKVIINATDALYLDGGGDTYIYEPQADKIDFVLGGDTVLSLLEIGSKGNAVVFTTSSATFLKSTGVFDISTSEVDFRLGNKALLAMTDDSTNLRLIFPAESGNFMLYITYDGDHDITNWQAFGISEAPATGSPNVMWPGGTKPETTTSGKDLFSFYWDGDLQIAFGVASLDFQIPS